MAKWVCKVCGYVHEGDVPPETCPICGVGAEEFERLDESATVDNSTKEEGQKCCSGSKKCDCKLSFVTEHVVGLPKDIDERIMEGLRANFKGECSEVGMYIAMSRVADREGYPEIAEAFKRYAFEEAEHAAKFAELLGEVVTDSTEQNLTMRVKAEQGACQGKMDLAKLAKQLNLDSVHDTVHEMAKDEARHGSGFHGLLKRYFAK